MASVLSIYALRYRPLIPQIVALPEDLVPMLAILGLHNVRASRLISMSAAYVDDPPDLNIPRKSAAYTLQPNRSPRRKARYPSTPISHLPGSGTYALDSYRIFCMPNAEWKIVTPSDKELTRYLVCKLDSSLCSL